LAPHIGYNFFPPADAVTQLINTFVIFAGGFVMRPLGGVLFGHIGATAHAYVLQCAAGCCGLLQRAAVCCSEWQCVAVCDNLW